MVRISRKPISIEYAKKVISELSQSDFGRRLYDLGFRLKINDIGIKWVGTTNLAKPWRDGPFYGRVEINYNNNRNEYTDITLYGDTTGLIFDIANSLSENDYLSVSEYYSKGFHSASMPYKEGYRNEKGLKEFMEKCNKTVNEKIRLRKMAEKGVLPREEVEFRNLVKNTLQGVRFEKFFEKQ